MWNKIHAVCTYCGRSGADSRDHVLPKQLLPKPLASYPKPIVVPAHRACNDAFRKDDEYFCSFILSSSGIHPVSDQPLSRFFEGIWKPGNEKFVNSLLSEVVPTGKLDADGEEIHIFRKAGDRVDRVLKRYVQGIARWEFKTSYIDPAWITVIHGPVDISLFDAMQPVLERVPYKHAFRFFCQSHPVMGVMTSTWLLVFYEKIAFQLCVHA